MGGDLLNEDRNYTQGLNASYFNLGLADRLSGKRPFRLKQDEVVQPCEISFQIAGFTPDDLRAVDPVIGDRPYSTVALLGLKYTTINTSRLSTTSKGLYVGMLGIDGPAENVQTKIHSKTNEGNTRPPYNPAGWHNQISNGGEPTAMFSYMTTFVLANDNLKTSISDGSKTKGWFQGTISYGFNLGYLTQGFIGMSMRIGSLNLLNFSNDPFNAMTTVSSLNKLAGLGIAPQKEIVEGYLFVSVINNLTLYNASLHGQFKETAYRLNYAETGFTNAQFRIGPGVTYKGINLAAYLAMKSPEMWNSYTRIHYWAGLSATVFWKKTT